MKKIILPGFIASSSSGLPKSDKSDAKHTKKLFDFKKPEIGFFTAIAIYLPITVLTALYFFFTVGSIAAPAKYFKISKSFFGLILILMITGAAEYVAASLHAYKQEMDWVVEAIIFLSLRISFFVLPLMIYKGWALGIAEITFFFDGFQIAVLLMTVLLVNFIIQDGNAR